MLIFLKNRGYGKTYTSLNDKFVDSDLIREYKSLESLQASQQQTNEVLTKRLVKINNIIWRYKILINLEKKIDIRDFINDLERVLDGDRY